MIGCMHEANDAPCPTCGTYLLNPLSKSAVSGTSSSSSSEDESTTMDDSNTTFAGPSARSSYPTASTPAQDSTANSSGGIVEENAVLLEENRKLTRSLLELQVETERLKQQQNLLSGLGRRRDSLSGLSSTSQPLGSMGQNSPAPSYRSTGNYTSGIVADVVREIRDICRVREDATFERLRNLQENHMWSINDTLQRLAKDVDTMQKSVSAARHDLEKLTSRVLQLESIVLPQAAVCLAAGAQHNHPLPLAPMPLFGGNVQQALLLQQLQQQTNANQQQQQQQQQQQHSPQTVPVSSGQQFHAFGMSERGPAGSAGGASIGSQSVSSNGVGKPGNGGLPSMLRLNYGRIATTEDLFGGDSVTVELGNGNNTAGGGGGGGGSSSNSTVASVHESSSRVLLLEKGEVELRRDLQDAIAAKNEQSKKIAYLQKVVMALQKKVDLQGTDTPSLGGNGSSSSGNATSNNGSSSGGGIGVIGPVTDL
ncbi:uncharacterized protein LOC1271909 isoform X1 [Anopheles gambiae]|uniref:uncharacterized protein LOC1271909 isoform X1 n=1 Tax=Anopheles gambiae TaxID=7165 RepID=UPI002AC9A029|nr:uncharacterized protein LOC1271909 isoform X1 [Anopheles gambiae]XP_061514708.1 uncharacterized protein LOC1271909 isoform X1 [Anopheles gambiae]XP_061514713.1 uncharacterized protein LOC1271909 isoform X1 [Anopheles gambiae]XP_061514714.1 uncharacterized protein LOC1271909 isoform X1 [Anopheles gambiae]XP_061514732.1 uncharacterized protein LOC1271909 isoform X1 [Anopheles gambiae]XP_061514758.1 uncharacterized protein LOC1271909 isoform X1 [Anopheles gambiae]XP_061514781.1 uncharacterize